jgi:hypothetical protein
MAHEEQVQSAVWHVELGRGKKVVLWVLTVLVAIALSLVYTALQFRGLEHREAMDMAQLARNISRGQGFTTYVIRPLSLWQLKESAPDHKQRLMDHPDLINPPLYPLVLAGLFKLLPAEKFAMPTDDRVFVPERWVIVPFAQICLLLSILLVYLWAKQLFDARVAVTAGLLLLFSDTLWGYSVSGLPMTFLLLLWLATLYLLFQADRLINPLTEGTPARRPQGLGLIVVSAVLLGLCSLTQYRAVWLVVPLALYVWRIVGGRRGWGMAALFAGVTLAVISPWLVRNFQICGNPFGIALYNLNGSEALQRNYHPDLAGLYTLKDWMRNLVTGTRTHLLSSLPNASRDFFVGFFLVGILYGFRRREVSRLRGALLGCLGAAGLGMALLPMPAGWSSRSAHESDLFLLLVPLVAVYAVAFFYLLLDRIKFNTALTRGLAVAAFVVVNVAAMVYTLLPPRRGAFPYPPYIAPYTAVVASWFGPAEIGSSDLPWAMAWAGDRRTVWLPATENEFIEINDFAASDAHLSFLMITPYMLNRQYQSELLKGEYKEWSGIVRGKMSADFPLKAATLFWPAGEQIVFADRPRWSEEKLDPSVPLPDKKKKPPAPKSATNAAPAAALN